MAQKRLLSELASLRKEKWVHLKVDESNLLVWHIGLMVVNPESIWDGAYLKAEMRFSREYPYQPPTFRFLGREMFHPNVYNDGRLCISILHTPGHDETSGEEACERWSPLQGVESVLRSVLLLLDDPETSSPANVDASVQYRIRRDEYNARARRAVEAWRAEIPVGVRFPTTAELEPAPQPHGPTDDDDFWNESDGGADAFGSESDEELDEAEFEEGDGEEEEEEEEEDDEDDEEEEEGEEEDKEE